MARSRPKALLIQLPIPPPGPQAIHGNIPLAAASLKLYARRRGLEERCPIELLPTGVTNDLGDRGLVEAILAREPSLVGLTCYVWNVERALAIAGWLKQARQELKVVLGGPEITIDNGWVLRHTAVDYAVIGEGEQTFAELLAATAGRGAGVEAAASIPGLWTPENPEPLPRMPLESLDAISSPYLEGILDVADERVMHLETLRGCTFRCKFCYYPKGYQRLHFLSAEKIAANLRHAAERGAREVVLLDPTINQRRDFAGFLRLLARHNPDQQLSYFGELRAEGITPKLARLLREANFSEVEVGLQSLDPRTQALMGRKVNLQALERGARAMRDEGITVRIDLILGLPGDTAASVRRGIEYLHRSGISTAIQVFNLSVLPGTAFRREAASLGLRYQARPPYYVLGTPTLTLEAIYALMEEAQDAFGREFDPAPAPVLDFAEGGQRPVRVARVELEDPQPSLPPPERRAHVFTLSLRSGDFDARRHAAAGLVRQLLADNPHTTLQVVLEPAAGPEGLSTRAFELLLEACYSSTSYLDLFYSLHPNRLLGAKRLVVLLPVEDRARLGPAWVDEAGRYATLVWHGGPLDENDLAPHEHVVPLDTSGEVR